MIPVAQSYEEWKASGGAVDTTPKSIESGNAKPEVLMPGSPLKDSATVETTVALALDEGAVGHPTLIAAGCGFVIGCLVTSLVFQSRIKKLIKGYEARIEESRNSLDRIVCMMSQK